METWLKIEDFENYSVSNMGNVRNDLSGQLVVPYNANGYYKVYLCGEKYNKPVYVHRLVAQAFLPQVAGKPEVDHINRCRDDNRVRNLRWVNRRENLLNREWCRPIKMIENGHIIDYFATTKDAAEYIMKAQNRAKLTPIQVAICQVCSKQRPTAYGYSWEYGNSNDYYYFKEINDESNRD